MIHGVFFYEMHVCEAIIDVTKHILPNQDNLEKHMEKQWEKHNILNKGLKKNQPKFITRFEW